MSNEVFESGEIYVGRDFGGYQYEITPAVIENYIAATGDDNPWYRGASPLGGPRAFYTRNGRFVPCAEPNSFQSWKEPGTCTT